MPPTLIHPIHLYALLGVYTPPYIPILLCICMFYMLWGIVRGPLTHWIPPLHLPLYGVPPLQFTPLPVIHWLPCTLVCFRDIYVIWGIFPLCLGLGGIPPSVRGFGASAHGVSICLFLYIIVVHYVSCFYNSYDYYSSSYSGVFWAIICSSVTVAPSLMGVPTALDQHGVVQPPPVMLRGSGGVIGPASVPQQQPPSSMPLLAYTNYAMGSP